MGEVKGRLDFFQKNINFGEARRLLGLSPKKITETYTENTNTNTNTVITNKHANYLKREHICANIRTYAEYADMRLNAQRQKVAHGQH